MGRTFTYDLEAMARGERARPSLLAGDPPAGLYGRVFPHEDPEVVGPDAPEFR